MRSRRPLSLLLLAALVSASLSLAFPRAARAQSPTFLALRDDHLRRQQAVLGYLAGAAGLSLAGGAVLLATDPPPFRGKPKEFRTSFAMLNLIYGVANTAFVIANFAGLDRQYDTVTNAKLLAWDRQRQGRALAMNAGLDMIYITLGFTLWATDNRPIVQGMGLGLALQGAVLAGFDGAGALLMTR
ncbi:MAG: hypothetical protein R3F14_28510 [Polyangiaceae bacterium]